MVVTAKLSDLPTHGRGDHLFTINKTPDVEIGKRKQFYRDKKTFTELWMRGFTYVEIASVLSICRETAESWRRRLKLPNRKCGYHKREQRVKQMAAHVTKQIEREGMRSVRDIFHSWGVLDADGKHVNGTDKETNHHYGDAYEDMFRAYDLNLHGWYSTRDKVKLMMEVGIADGSSLCAWRDIFPNALCVGLDIHHSDKAHGDRIEFHLGDQRSKEDCERAAAGRQFDFICEDATHDIGNTLLTLYWLWPFVKPGGIYVVEEWAGIDRERISALFPTALLVNTIGPSGGIEPLVVLRKPR